MDFHRKSPAMIFNITSVSIWWFKNSWTESLFLFAGWAILNGTNPSQVLQRSKVPLLTPTLNWELGTPPAKVCVPNVVFAEGLFFFFSFVGTINSELRWRNRIAWKRQVSHLLRRSWCSDRRRWRYCAIYVVVNKNESVCKNIISQNVKIYTQGLFRLEKNCRSHSDCAWGSEENQPKGQSFLQILV